MRSTTLAVATLLAALAPAVARAAPPSELDAEHLRELVGTDSGPVLLVGLGSAFSATRAVRQVLERGGHLVRQPALAERPALHRHLIDGADLCRIHGTEVVVIVEDLTPERATATVVDAAGVARGTVLLGAVGPRAVPAPVSALALDAYQSGALGVDLDGPYQGHDRRRLTWEDFYRITGRADLVDAQADLRRWRYGLGGVGGTALGVGLLWGIADVTLRFAGAVAAAPFCLISSLGERSDSSPRTKDPWCEEPQPSAVPWVVAATGAGMLLAIPLVPRQPTSADASRAMASAHNQQLRQRYGLTVEASPLVGPGTGGLLLRGQF